MYLSTPAVPVDAAAIVISNVTPSDGRGLYHNESRQ